MGDPVRDGGSRKGGGKGGDAGKSIVGFDKACSAGTGVVGCCFGYGMHGVQLVRASSIAWDVDSSSVRRTQAFEMLPHASAACNSRRDSRR